jgi:histidinol phosphatase-like enzyme
MKFIALLFSFALCAATIETNHFREILDHTTPDTLIILDIDDTLLIPTQMLGCDEWFLHRVKQTSLEKALAEWEAIRHLTKMEIVEPGTEEIVATLQNSGHTVLGLTTQGLALATRTVQQLKENHIDLSLACPFSNDHYFINKHGVLYRQGILFTSGTPKGEALFKLCDDLQYKPKRILFINDKATHLADLEKTALERGVEFIGLRYAYSDARKAKFSTEIADIQFRPFEHILTDEEAQLEIQ